MMRELGLILSVLASLSWPVQPQCHTVPNLPEGCIVSALSTDCDPTLLHLACTFETVGSYLTVQLCNNDPVPVTLEICINGTCNNQTYSVGGPQPVSECQPHWSVVEPGGGGYNVTADYKRNTTYLWFGAEALFKNGTIFTVLPAIILPLTPHLCMCQSLDTVADSFSFQLPLPVTPQHNCTRDQDCTAVTCTFNDNEDLPLKFTFDPCREAIIMSGTNPVTGQSELAVFNETEDRPFIEGESQFTVHMDITNHNYSMRFSAAVSSPQFGSAKITVFPSTLVILDRSACDNLVYYHDPWSGDVSRCTSWHGTTPGPSTTTTSGSEITPTVHSTPSETTPTVHSTPSETTPTVHSTPSETTPTIESTVPPTDCPGLTIPFSPDHIQCWALDNCSGIGCSIGSLSTTTHLQIAKCSDPVTVDLTVQTGSSLVYQARYFVGGPEQSHHTAPNGISAQWSRNTTHLNFRADGIFQGDILTTIIPNLEFSLDAHFCMCDSLDSIAANFSIPNAPSTCTTDYTTCSTVNCVFAGAEDSPVNFRVDACQETLVVVGANENGEPERTVFNETETRPVPELSGAYINAVLVNHNYSMELMLGVDAGQFGQINLIPMTHIILDRSTCTNQALKYYPGEVPAPIIYHMYTPPTIPGPTTPSVTTPPEVTPPAPVSITAIAVSIPLVILISLVVVVTIAVVVVVLLRRRKKRVDTYSFRQLAEDDDDFQVET